LHGDGDVEQDSIGETESNWKDVHKVPQLYSHQHHPSRRGGSNIRGIASLAKIFLMSDMAGEVLWNKAVGGVLRLGLINRAAGRFSKEEGGRERHCSARMGRSYRSGKQRLSSDRRTRRGGWMTVAPHRRASTSHVLRRAGGGGPRAGTQPLIAITQAEIFAPHAEAVHRQSEHRGEHNARSIAVLNLDAMR
jgi:hypothetical protein